MSTDYSSRTLVVIKGILASQILSVPFSSSLSLVVLIFASRYWSKTSISNQSQKFFEYPQGRPARVTLARFGSALVALICVLMTIMELTIVYQTALTRADDIEFLTKIPWTSSLIPVLSSIVSIPAQTYFSNKACHVVQRPRILMFFLAILGLVSIATGTAASLALLIQSPQRTGEIALVSAAEGLFWSYLILITVSSLAISVPLVINFLRERRSLKNGINSKALAPAKPTKTTSSLRFLFSTYLMVFVIDFICFVSAVVSASPNFNAALHASQAFLVLQKLMVRVMAMAYVYALIEGIPKSPSLNISAPYMDNGFGNQKDHTTSRLMGSLKNKPSKFFKNPDLREIHSSSVINLTKFNTHAHAPIPMEDEDEEEDNGGEEIFLYHYPSNVISPLGLESYSEDGANRVSKASSYGSLNKNYQLPAVGIPPSEKLPPIPKKPKYILPAMARKSSINSPPNLPTMPGKVHQINSNKKKDKHDRRVSTIKYISSNSSGTFQSCEL